MVHEEILTEILERSVKSDIKYFRRGSFICVNFFEQSCKVANEIANLSRECLSYASGNTPVESELKRALRFRR